MNAISAKLNYANPSKLISGKKAQIWDFLVDNLFWIAMLLVILIIIWLLYTDKMTPLLQGILDKMRFF
ncbi:TPA: hypothetical protein HA219_00730 [Candidatus Woesearchaeota archaeon]|nr:hypothetical protein [Candidatus Woesearchaeota archaeon]HIH39238.1 hypothetical protein [Candidatus Woesearchaeota archaeon]